MKIIVLMSILTCLVLPAAGIAEDTEDYAEGDMITLRPGLEQEEVSPGVNVVIPKGAEKRQVNTNLSVLESAEEYSARNFVYVNDRVDKMQKDINLLKKEVYFLKKALHDMKKKEETKSR